MALASPCGVRLKETCCFGRSGSNAKSGSPTTVPGDAPSLTTRTPGSCLPPPVNDGASFTGSTSTVIVFSSYSPPISVARTRIHAVIPPAFS